MEHSGRRILILALATALASDVLVQEVRAPMVALQTADFKRSNRSSWRASAVGLVGVGIGTPGVVGGARGAGLGLMMGGLSVVVGEQYALSTHRRRHARFVRRLAEMEGRSFHALLTDLRMDADRRAQHHALATGIYGTLVAAGVGVAAGGRGEFSQLGLGLSVSSVTGLVHHLFRWRASNRLAVDYASVRTLPPTRLR